MKKEYYVFAADDATAHREHNEKKHEFRTDFQRDRDRILYSKEFRRLSGKTQVFVAGFDDHMRTRLTHTLEVAQIANTVLRELGLNEILGEAIALGHDLGHTPFGHIGERTLNYIMNGCDGQGDFECKFLPKTKGFKHNWQGIRTVTHLENIDDRYDGLNLTDSVRWGILRHTSSEWGKCEYSSKKTDLCNLRHHSEIPCEAKTLSLDYYKDKYVLDGPKSWSIEAIIVKYADDIAQRHHDVEDGLLAGLIDKAELIAKFKECFGEFMTPEDKNRIEKIEGNDGRFVPMFASLIINFLTTQLINAGFNREVQHLA